MMVSARPNGDARMWVGALFVSVVVNLLILGLISYHVITREETRREDVPKSPTPETVITIFPDMLVPPPVVEEEVESAKKEAVRTSPDQETAEPPESKRYIGERNTKATSDRAPDADALEMPSQAGRVPEEREQMETTESDYQDGSLVSENQPAPPLPLVPEGLAQPSPLQPAPEVVKGDTKPDEGEAEKPETAIREKLLESPNVVETPVEKAEVLEDLKPREEQKAREGKPDGVAEEKPKEKPKDKPKETARRQPVDDPAFRGNQSKTRIQGSISRTGRSALDVEDTPLGRYQAQISRAVEQEWQRNVMKHRDFITPGYLTVRFFVQADGKVKSVNFIGEIQTGEIQKGFTLNSIREADIPAMPPALKKEMGGDALELIFNFYF